MKVQQNLITKKIELNKKLYSMFIYILKNLKMIKIITLTNI